MEINIPIEEQKINVIKWLDALLSGKYKQTINRLGSFERGYCCWGLGCDIINIPFDPEEGWNYLLYEYIGFNNKYGLIEPNVNSIDNKGLDYLNDYLKLNFKEIAAYLIEYSNYNFSPEISVHIDEYYKNKEEVKNLIKELKANYIIKEEEICE